MKRFELFFVVIQIPLDFFMLLFAALSAYGFRFTDWAVRMRPILFDLKINEYLNIVIPVILGWMVIFAFVGLYSTDQNRKFVHDIVRVVLACSAGLAAVALYIMFTQQLFDSRFLAAGGWALGILLVSFGRLMIRGLKAILYRQGIGLRNVAIVGGERTAEKIVEALRQRRELGYHVIGVFETWDEHVETLLEKQSLDEVILTEPEAKGQEAIRAIEWCYAHHIVCKYSADLFGSYAVNIVVHPLAGVPVVELKRTPLDGWGRVLKRGFDIVLSVLIIIFLALFLFLLAFCILLETGRPVLYRNERVGLRGKHFATLKFRSMYQKYCTGSQFGEEGDEALIEEEKLKKMHNTRQGPIYKLANDPRVTPFGRFLRRWSLDELPQFFNVLSGTMSIVGPRPHQPREVEKYEQRHRSVLTLKPGITGLAQVSGRSDLSYEEEVKLDIFYIEKWSLLLDSIIFLKTPFVLFKKRKAL